MTDSKKWVPKSNEAAREEGERLRKRLHDVQLENLKVIYASDAWLDEQSASADIAAQLRETEYALGQLLFDLADLRDGAEDDSQLSEAAFRAVVEQVAPTLKELAECDREAVLVTLRIQQLEEERDELQRKLDKLK